MKNVFCCLDLIFFFKFTFFSQNKHIGINIRILTFNLFNYLLIQYQRNIRIIICIKIITNKYLLKLIFQKLSQK